jgi:hypothetical protein
VRWGVLAFVLLAAATPSASAASEQVMTPAMNCCSMLTETLDGVVTATLPLPTLPYDAEVAHDGSVVFRASEGAGYEGIWVARPGQAPVHVTTDVRDTTPTITYDGTRIAFTRITPGVGTGDLYIANSDGTGVTQLLSGGQTQQYRDPEFSPDGNSIAVICTPAGPGNYAQLGCGPQMDGSYTGWGVILIGVDGSNKRLILKAAGQDPSWFPAGQRLAVVMGSGEFLQIFAYKTDGSDLFAAADADRQITDESAPIFRPSISPDGSRVLVLETQNSDGTGCGGCSVLITIVGRSAQKLHLQGFPYAQFVPPALGGAPPATVDATHVYVPVVRGLKVTAAKTRLRRAHMIVGTVRGQYSGTIPRGRVIAIRPRAGTRMHRTSKAGPPVTLFVSRGRKR